MRLLKIITLTTLMSLAPLTHAADLNDAEIQKWATAASALQAWGKQHQTSDLVPEGHDAAAMKNPAQAFTNGMIAAKKTPHYGDIQGVLKQNGYSDADEWAQLGDRIIAAYFANSMSKHPEVSPEQVNMAMQQMQNNPNIPPHLRAQMEQAMQGSRAMLESAQNVPAEDKLIVQRNAKVLDKFFKAQ